MLDYKERKQIVWMQWLLDSQNPFEYFEKARGYKATKIILGDVPKTFIVPDGIDIVASKFNLKNQIMLV